jgi:hypothetical protein
MQILTDRDRSERDDPDFYALSKALSLIILAMMALHLWRPLDLPGLHRRQDVWKIALVALAAMGLTVLLSHGG